MSGAFCVLSVVLAGAAWATPVEQVIFDHVEYQGNWGPGISKTVTLPAAAVMRNFDTMSMTLTLGCINKACPPWDFVANLSLCTSADATACNTEIGRWVTPYGAGGTWTTQADQMLALLRKGGKQTFYFWTPQPYTLTIKLTFDNKNKGRVPISATPLFSGGDLTPDYNARHKPIKVTIGTLPERAEIYAITTGHGWGGTAENCAEFCNIQQLYNVNGLKTYTRDQPNAGTATGCANEVAIGVIANQAGTWQYGRDGWCPGLDVKPYIADITANLRVGENVFTYGAYYKGKPYVATPLADPAANAIGPTIQQSSYLIQWASTLTRPAPTASPNTAPGDNTDSANDSNAHSSDNGTIAGAAQPEVAPDEPAAGPTTSTPATPYVVNSVPDTATGGMETQNYGCAALSPDFFLWTFLGLSLGLYRPSARRGPKRR